MPTEEHIEAVLKMTVTNASGKQVDQKFDEFMHERS